MVPRRKCILYDAYTAPITTIVRIVRRFDNGFRVCICRTHCFIGLFIVFMSAALLMCFGWMINAHAWCSAWRHSTFTIYYVPVVHIVSQNDLPGWWWWRRCTTRVHNLGSVSIKSSLLGSVVDCAFSPRGRPFCALGPIRHPSVDASNHIWQLSTPDFVFFRREPPPPPKRVKRNVLHYSEVLFSK